MFDHTSTLVLPVSSSQARIKSHIGDAKGSDHPGAMVAAVEMLMRVDSLIQIRKYWIKNSAVMVA